MNAAANEAPRCSRCGLGNAAIDCAGWCIGCYSNATAKLSAKQLELMCRAATGEYVELEPHEIAPAGGLERRRLVRTYRPSKRSWSMRPKYEIGSRRSLDLTPVGRAFVEAMEPAMRARYATRRSPGPVTREEAIELARELARIVIAESVSMMLINRARAVLEQIERRDAT